MSVEINRWFYRRGELSRDGWETVVDDQLAGWSHSGLRIAEVAVAHPLQVAAAAVERMIIPLNNGFTIEFESSGRSGTIELEGRRSVFDGPTDVAYLPPESTITIRGEGRIAIAEAPTAVRHPVSVISRESVPVELRGAGRSSRQVHNFGTPGNLLAERLIVCEVITPSENWSSYPAHKHDEFEPGNETRLEEIYYFECEAAREEQRPDVSAFGMFATYSSRAGQIETNALVRSGDVALVPFGYHGPAAAAPGYDLYYLNVMAGPDSERAWLIRDDPAQAWIRSGWDSQPIDARLPFTPRES